jgi:hypothetical protein
MSLAYKLFNQTRLSLHILDNEHYCLGLCVNSAVNIFYHNHTMCMIGSGVTFIPT